LPVYIATKSDEQNKQSVTGIIANKLSVRQTLTSKLDLMLGSIASHRHLPEALREFVVDLQRQIKDNIMF